LKTLFLPCLYLLELFKILPYTLLLLNYRWFKFIIPLARELEATLPSGSWQQEEFAEPQQQQEFAEPQQKEEFAKPQPG
jgi:hypothetical protein